MTETATSSIAVPLTETVTLTVPVTIGGTKVSALTMRRPKVRDHLAVERMGPDTSSAERETRLFANLCDVPQDALLDLDMADYAALQQAFMGFLRPRQES